MSLLHDLRNLFKQDKQPPVTTVKAKAEIPAPVIPVVPNPPHQDIPDQAKPAPAGGTIVRQVEEQQPSPPEILAQIDWAVKNAKTYSTGDLIENRYKVEEVMSGAMGYVYIGRDARQQITFAIKQPKESMLADRDLFSRVLQEADSWTGLGMHPNIAYCYFVKQIEEVPHIFIEYVNGGSLEEWISDRRCADYKVGLDMAIQFCHGLERAHDRGMIHRDIKPRNILVTKEGLVKVTDFGIAGGIKVGGKGGAISGDQQATRMGAMMGTQAYMSPEQFRDPRQKSAEAPKGVWYESDVYSFGVCLWEMFCGRRPREISIGVTGDTPDPQSLRRDISAGLRTLLLSSVDLDREKRPHDFNELKEKLNGIYRYLFSSDAPHYQLELHDTTADELNNQGYSYYELGKKEEARKCFEAAVEVNNTHPEAVFNLALLRWRAGEIDDLEVLIRIRNCSSNPLNSQEKIAELLAYIHAERCDPDSAKDELQAYPQRLNELFDRSNICSIGLIRTFEGHSESVSTVSLSADGRFAISGSHSHGDNPGSIKLWNVSTGECIKTLIGHSKGTIYDNHDLNFLAGVESVSLSKDSKYALSGGWGGILKLWDVKNGECLRSLEGHSDCIDSVYFSGDSKYGISSSSGTIKLWEIMTGKCIRTFEEQGERIIAKSLSADFRLFLSASSNYTLKLWEIATGKCIKTFQGHEGPILFVCLSIDGKYAFSMSYDNTFNTFKQWEIATGLCLHTSKFCQHSQLKTVINSNGKYALSYGIDRIRLWEVSTGQCLRTFLGHRGHVNSITLSNDGQYALSGGADKTIKLWKIAINNKAYASVFQVADFKNFQEVKVLQNNLRLAVEKAEGFIKDGKFSIAFEILYSAWEREGFRDNVDVLKVYDELYARSRKRLFIFWLSKKCFEGHSSYVASVAFSTDARYALSGSWDHTLKLWELSSGQCLRTFEGHTEIVTSVALTTDGRYALSGSNDKMLKLWDVSTGLCLRTFEGHCDEVWSVSLSDEGKYALSSSDKTLKLWEVSTGQCLRTIIGHKEGVFSVSISADGRFALSGSVNEPMKLWELSTGQCLRTFEGHDRAVISVCLSVDGRHALSGSADNTLKLWDVNTGQCLHTFEGHSEWVYSVSLSADGKYALSGSRDKTMKLWDVSTGQCLRTIEGHNDKVTSVSLSADGRYALSGSEDNTLKLWRLIWKLEFD